MKKYVPYHNFACSILLFIFLGIPEARLWGQEVIPGISQAQLLEDLEEMLYDISHYYSYREEKDIDWDCLKDTYTHVLKEAQKEEDVVLAFEFLLDEFYDSHIILNTNRVSSYRLYSPIHAVAKHGKVYITQVWQTQLEHVPAGFILAEIVNMNGCPFAELIDAFPSKCQDKTKTEVREWLANKVLAGRYNEPRLLELRLPKQGTLSLNLDSLTLRKEKGLLSSRKEGEIGIIRIHNQLGNNQLIPAFDQALNSLANTKALILDLRNTVDGGNTYVARGIMGRFVTEPRPYQKHWTREEYLEGQAVTRSWVEYVSPRDGMPPYQKPLVVLVGRWTGSMGEGLAIGLEAAAQAKILGTEMERLAGSVYGFSFNHVAFGYRLSTQKLFHVNGTAREKYIPTHYFSPTGLSVDETLLEAIQLIEGKN